MWDLITMAEAVKRDSWDRTSELWVLLANIHRDPDKTLPFHPADIHPYREREEYHDPNLQELAHFEKVKLLPPEMQAAAIKGMQRVADGKRN